MPIQCPVTPSRELQDEVRRYAEQAERANAALQEFAYVASHDLTEPLRMVTAYLELLERRAGDRLDDECREFLFYASDGAHRMKALIDDLLLFSRVGNAPPRRDHPTDLAAVADEVRRSLQVAIAETGATLLVDPELPVVAMEQVHLAQLLQNLVANAVKFHRPGAGSTVRIGAHRTVDDDGWAITVSDDGIGIDRQHADRIFQVFQRLHGREEYEGNGIGLAICRRIAERYGGTIGVDSEPGVGSTFTFVLPDPVEMAVA